MSTTVSYKGNTIATVDNNTKTLTTAGTWLEADIVLTDTTIDGNELAYGFTISAASSRIGVGQIDYMEIE